MITAQLNGDFTQAKAYEETLAYLQSNPAPDVVYCENDNMCFGVMQALDELGIAYGTGGETPEKQSYVPEQLFTADRITDELLESRVY